MHDSNFASAIYDLMEKQNKLSAMPSVDLKDQVEKFWV